MDLRGLGHSITLSTQPRERRGAETARDYSLGLSFHSQIFGNLSPIKMLISPSPNPLHVLRR